MPKIVNIQYNPALSVKENAKKNHVSETSIRNYIQKNNLDRRHDRKQNIIADCKKYLKKHPNTSRNELQRITGHSLSTIRKYWKYISTEETLTDFNPKKQQKRLLRQEHNFYATHPSVTQDLLREEQFHSKVLEPFCGGGSMAEVIKQNGYEVEAYDLVDRGYGKVGDFFTTDFPKKEYDIITNPPYDDNLIEIVKRCLSICKNKVAILLPIQYLSGKERYSELYTKYPPVRVYIYCERINIAKGGDFDKYSDSGANMTIYAWYVWEKGFKGSTELQWIHNVRKVKEDTLTVNDNKELKRITAQEEKKKQIEYLRSIPREVIFDYLEKTTTKEGKKITVTKDRELWSDVLRDIPLMFETADSDDISGLKEFLYEKPEMPMLFVGSGGQQGSYPALLYGMNKGIGMSLTPLRFAALSDDTIRNSRIVLLSKSGGNSDIDYASKRAIQLNPDNTACITTRLEKVSRQWKKTKENKLLKNLNGTSAKVFLFHHPEITSGFTSVRGKFYKYALYYRAFSGVDSVSKLLPVDLEPEHCFTYQLNHDDSTPVSLEWIEHFCVLYSGYGEPVAQDFESVMTEAGVCSVQICDYRNYCHGRFIFPSNFTENTKGPRYRSNVAMVLFVSPRDKKLAESIRKWAIPSKTPVIIVETPYNSALATIDLLVKSNVLIGYICEQAKRINPYEPNNYNAKDVDKRYPITNVKFRQELKDNGELQYVEDEKKSSKPQPKSKKAIDVDNLKSLIEECEEVERKNSQSLQCLPPPTVQDLTKWEEYDASKYLCYAFRKKPDKRKGQWIPFGNMNKDFPFELFGNECETSEGGYICGLFSNNEPQHIALQERLLKETNGRKTKKDIRHNFQDAGRKDWYDFNVQWMLYVVWQKVQGSAKFRQLLMAVPEGATIIEDTTFQKGTKGNDTTIFWGAKNNERKDFEAILKKYIDATEADKKKGTRTKIKLERFNNFTDYGTFRGSNVMGKILTICRKCLQDGTEPDIDYALLRSKRIYLMGTLLTF